MRDRIKDSNYFKSYIAELNEMIAFNISSLNKGSIPEGRILWVKMNTFNYQLNKTIAMYSSGYSFDQVTEQLISTINGFFIDAWVANLTKVHLGADSYLDQYTIEPYGKMLRMLSIGLLLNIDDEIFGILVKKIDNDNVSDKLYEFIIKQRFKSDRQNKRVEDYDQDKSVILKVYKNLRRAINSDVMIKSNDLIQKYLEKDFNHIHSGFYNSHKSRSNVYFGYWSFEAAAIVAILGLDDSKFQENLYYPKDLVNYYRSTVKNLSFY